MHGRHARVELGEPLEKPTAPTPNNSRSVGRAPGASAKSMRNVPCPGLKETPPPTAQMKMPTPGEDFETGPPQGARDADGRAGVDKQGHGVGVLGLTRDEHARAGELAVQVGHAGGVAPEAYGGPLLRDEPGPLFSGRLAEAEALLLKSALGEHPSQLVVDSSYVDLELGAWLTRRVVGGVAGDYADRAAEVEAGENAARRTGSFWTRRPPPWGKPRRASSVGGELEAAAPLPEATASASRWAAASAVATFFALALATLVAGPRRVSAKVTPVVAGRRAASEAHHAVRVWRLLVAQVALCFG